MNQLEAQNPAPAVEQLLRQVGRRLAVPGGPDALPLEQRVQQAAAVLTELGGLAKWSAKATTSWCAVTAVRSVRWRANNPLTCRIAEALVASWSARASRNVASEAIVLAARFRIVAA